MNNKPAGYNKAVIAYLTFIGMLIAYYMNRDERDEFATWHIRNMFGLVIILLVSQVTQSYIHLFIGEILWICVFIWWLYAMVLCIMGKKAIIPGISNKFQQWFTFLE